MAGGGVAGRPTLTRRQQQGEESRREVLDVATRLLAERGYAGMSVSRLSQEAGLSASSIYWHFGSKDGVLAAVLDRGLAEFFARRVPAAQYDGAPDERLEQMLETSAEQLEAEPEHLRLLLLLLLQDHDGGDSSRDVVGQMREASRANWEAALAPLLGDDGSAEQRDLARDLAVLGRCVSDGAFIASISGEAPMASVYATFLRVLRAFTTRL